MNVLELQKAIKDVIASIKEHGENPKDVVVSLQIERVITPPHEETPMIVCSSEDIEVCYDNNGCCSGCTIVAQNGESE